MVPPSRFWSDAALYAVALVVVVVIAAKIAAEKGLL